MKLLLCFLLIAFAAFVCCQSESDPESSMGEAAEPSNAEEPPQSEEGDVDKIQVRFIILYDLIVISNTLVYFMGKN